MSPLNVILDKELIDSFSITRLENRSIEYSLIYRSDYHRIFFITNGRGTVQIDNVPYIISKDQLYLVAKGQMVSFLQDTQFSGYELCFGDCFWERTPASASNCKAVLFNNASANQQLSLELSDLYELENLFSVLFLEFTKETYLNKIDALAAYLKIIMIKIANINATLKDGYNTFEKQIYRQFLDVVSGQYKTTHEVAEFAQQLGVSARKLSDLCKRCSGTGAKEIINGQLIAEAKRSLQFSSKPVKEIAIELNFSSPGQFSHFFKKNTQVSPHDYRQHFVNIGM